MPPKTQKEPASVMADTKLEKNFVTTKARVQLKQVAIEEAKPRTSGENNSDIMSQGIGPNPTLKAKTKIDKDAMGSICSRFASSVSPRLIFM